MPPEDYSTSDLINSAQAFVNNVITPVSLANAEVSYDDAIVEGGSISSMNVNNTSIPSSLTLSSSGSLNVNGNISNVSSPYTIQGSGTAPYTTTWTYGSSLSPDIDRNGDPPEKIAGVLKDLVEDYEGKLDECDKKLDEIVKEMKSKPDSLQVLNSTFQYWVAFKYAYQGVIKKLQDYIKDYEETGN